MLYVFIKIKMSRKIFVLFLSFAAFLSISSVEAKSYTTSELLQMTHESLNADWQTNTAYVRGVGRILQDDSQGLLLARRAALTDARRGLLLLRKEILSSDYKQNSRSLRLSGHVPPLRLLSETINDELYFVEIEAELSRLLSENGKAYLSKIYNLVIEEN